MTALLIPLVLLGTLYESPAGRVDTTADTLTLQGADVYRAVQQGPWVPSTPWSYFALSAYDIPDAWDGTNTDWGWLPEWYGLQIDAGRDRFWFCGGQPVVAEPYISGIGCRLYSCEFQSLQTWEAFPHATWHAVPEPRSAVLLLLGLLGCRWMWRRTGVDYTH